MVVRSSAPEGDFDIMPTDKVQLFAIVSRADGRAIQAAMTRAGGSQVVQLTSSARIEVRFEEAL